MIKTDKTPYIYAYLSLMINISKHFEAELEVR